MESHPAILRQRFARSQGRTTVLGAVVLALLIVAGVSFFVWRTTPEAPVRVPDSETQEAMIEASTAKDAASEPEFGATPDAAAPVADLGSEAGNGTKDPHLVLTGVVRGAQGPIAGAVVHWLPSDRGDWDAVRYDASFLSDLDVGSSSHATARADRLTARSGEDGTYRLVVAKARNPSGVALASHPNHTTVVRDLGAGPDMPELQVGGAGAQKDDVGADPVRDVIPNENGEVVVQLDFELAPAGQITGRVVDARSGQPAAGMKVTATLHRSDDSPWARLFFNQGHQGPQASVAEDGSYRLQGLKPAEYRVVAETGDSEYVPTRGGGSRKVLLAAHTVVDGVDLLAELGGVIEGRVVDVHGAGVGDARVIAIASDLVQAMMKGDTEGLGLMGREPVQSAPDGSFRVRGLALGKTYEVSSAHEGLAFATSPGVELTEEQRLAVVEIVLTEGSTISGILRYTTGEVASDETVGLTPDFTSGWANSAMMFLGQGVNGSLETGPDGSFEFAHLRAGKYRLQAGDSGGFAFFGRDSDKVKTIEVDGVTHVANVELSIEREPEVLPEGAPGTLSGIVIDDLGQPVPGANIQAVSLTGGGLQVTSAEADGRFRMEVTGSGSFHVTAEAKGFGGASEQAEPGTTGLTLVLSRLAHVSGRVLLPDGAVPGLVFRVSAERVEPEGDPTARLRRVQFQGEDSADGKPDGTFTLADVDVGRIRLVATVPGFAPTASHEFEVAAGSFVEGIEFTVTRGGVVAGSVQLTTGQPLSGARVILVADDTSEAEEAMRLFMPGMGGQEFELTDMDGRFEIARVTPGAYRISATHPEYAASEPERVRVGEDQRVEVRPLRLSPGATVRGVVRFGDETRQGVMVQLVSSEHPFQMANTDPRGSYRFTGVAPGEYALQVIDLAGSRTTGMAMRIRTLQVEGDGEIELNLDFKAGRTVFGNIRGVAGGMRMVTIRRPGGPLPEEMNPMDMKAQVEFAKYTAGMTMVTEDGEYRVEGVEPGEYVLEVPFMPENPLAAEAQQGVDRTPFFRKEIRVGDADVEVDIELEK
ncbi:MAG: carboxypeptidase regulatory-like domain-containing protein [Planctomycetota bacterium]